MKLKRVLCMTLAVMMAVMTVGCGSKDGAGSSASSKNGKDGGSAIVGANKATHFFRAEYMENLPEDLVNLGRTFFAGEKFYYTSYGMEYDSPMVGCIDFTTGDSSVIWKAEAGNTDISVNNMCADKDGNIYIMTRLQRMKDDVLERYADTTEEDIIKYIYEDWGFDSYESAEDYWKSNVDEVYYKDKSPAEIMAMFAADYDTDYVREDYLSIYDKDGNEKYHELIEVPSGADIPSMRVDAKGNLLMSVIEWTEDDENRQIIVVGSDGNKKGNIQVDGYFDSFVELYDGTIAFIDTTDYENIQVLPVNVDEMKIGDPVGFKGMGYIYDIKPLSETEYLINTDSDVKKYNLQTGESEKYFIWLDSNINSSCVRDFSIFEDGSIGVYMQNYGGAGNEVDLAVMHEISEEEANAVKPINAVCFYSSYMMQNAALEFNKKHSDYRITITEYYDYDGDVEYEDAMDSFVTDCATDDNIDVVLFASYSQMLDFADKGLLTDLSALAAADDKINKDTIIPAITNACTYKESLAALPISYDVQTLLGKASVVGTERGWTVKQCLDAYNKSGAKEILPYRSRSDMLNILVSLNYDEFVDLENAKCNFNNEDFQGVLELSAKFPEKYEYDDETNEYDDFQSGRTMLSNDWLPNFDVAQELECIAGEDITYIGYPTSNGNGAMMQLSNLTGITTNCDEPAMAWEFMRNLFLPEDAMYDGATYYNGSILSTELDSFLDGAKEWNDRGETEINGHTVKYTTPTDAEIEEMRDIIKNATAVADAAPTAIMNIISEEAAAYYSGEKSAADVAAIVQSRVDIYLNETR